LRKTLSFPRELVALNASNLDAVLVNYAVLLGLRAPNPGDFVKQNQ